MESKFSSNVYHHKKCEVRIRTVIPDDCMILKLSYYYGEMKSGKNVEEKLERLCIELNALESIKPLIDTEIVDMILAQFDDGSLTMKEKILIIIEIVMKTSYKNVIASKNLKIISKIFKFFDKDKHVKMKLSIIKEFLEIEEHVIENILKHGGLQIILNASNTNNAEILLKCVRIIFLTVLYGGKNSIFLLVKNDINQHMVTFLHSYKDKTINYFAYFTLIYLRNVHKLSNEFFEDGLMDNVLNFLSENELFLRSNAAIECNDKEKLSTKLLPLLSSTNRITKAFGTFQICCELSANISSLKIFNDFTVIKILRRIAVYSNSITSDFAINALFILTNNADLRIKKFKFKPVVEWETQDVQKWLKIFGFEDYVTFFDKVNGEILLRVKESDLKANYFMLDESKRKSFIEERSVLSEENPKMIDFIQNDLAVESMIEYKIEGRPALIDSNYKDVRKTFDAFISYRRQGGSELAILISYYLKMKRYKVFLDVKSLGAGKFGDKLKESIQKSRNFILLLTTDALDRCKNEDDWIRIEIEMALKSKCNIIPITQNFDNAAFDGENLPTEIRDLREFNQILWHHDLHDSCLMKIEKYIQPRDHNRLQSFLKFFTKEI